MRTISFNRNYMYNSKHNLTKINKTVRELLCEDVNSKPFDFLFRSNSRDYPKATHNLLELPGTFEKEEDTAVFVRNNGVLQMDYCETAKLDGSTVFNKILYDVEHQVRELPDVKVPIIYNYCFNTSLRLKNPCYPFVATNEDYPPKQTYLVDGFDFVIYFRVFNKEKVYKLLNTVSQKDYSKEELSDEDYLKLVYCLVFAKKEFAQDIIEKIMFLFATIEKIRSTCQLDLHLALKIMIKYHFKGNDEKIRELLTMITKTVHESKTEEIPSLEKMKLDYEKLKNELTQKNAELTQKNAELTQKDAKIEELRKMLLKNGIVP